MRNIILFVFTFATFYSFAQNEALVYFMFGDIDLDLRNYNSALNYYNKSINLDSPR